jgi:hypothetical protein
MSTDDYNRSNGGNSTSVRISKAVLEKLDRLLQQVPNILPNILYPLLGNPVMETG